MSTRARNLCPMFVLVFLLNGGVVPEDVVALSVFTFACFGWFVLQGVHRVLSGKEVLLGQRMLYQMIGMTAVC